MSKTPVNEVLLIPELDPYGKEGKGKEVNERHFKQSVPLSVLFSLADGQDKVFEYKPLDTNINVFSTEREFSSVGLYDYWYYSCYNNFSR